MNDNTPQIGHNRPPKTPFEEAVERIDLLHTEATNWLDGDAIENQGQADAVSKLLDDARKAKKAADDARKAEAKPFDDGKAEVQARYKPLLSRADTIADACKKVLAPFLAKIEAEARAAERLAREKADRKAAEARAAYQAAAATDLAAREEAERRIEEAKAAEAAAKRMEKDKAKATGGARAVTLRTVYHGRISDPAAVARHYWHADRAALEEFLTGLVNRDVRAGRRDIPGVDIFKEEVAQ